jgi:hypothetical protein
MGFSQWEGAFRQYRAALGQVDNPLVRRGQAVWQGTKKELADMLGRSGSALDNFLANFPELIEIQQPWHGREGQGAVRFALHPLEREIVGLVEERGERKPVLLPRTAKAEQVPALGYPALQEELGRAGYRQRELDTALEAMEARQMLRWDRAHGQVVLLAPDVPDLGELRERVEQYLARLETLQPLLEAAYVQTQLQTWRAWRKALAPGAAKLPDPAQLINVDRGLVAADRQLEDALAARRRVLAEEAARRAEAGALDTHLLDLLQRPATGGLFSDRLNDARVDLLKNLTTAGQQLESHRNALRQLAVALPAPRPLADRELARLAKQMTTHLAGLEELRGRRDDLTRLGGRYREAERLLSDASSLLNDKILVLGAEVAEERRSLGRWAEDVAAEIATRRVDALSDVESWRDGFERLREHVIGFEQRVRGAYAETQQGLRALLTERLNLPPTQLWVPLVFNPLDPPGSYAQLDQAFRDRLRQIFDQLERVLDDLARRAGQRTLAEPDDGTAGPERAAPQDDLAAIEEEARRYLAALAEAREPALGPGYVTAAGLDRDRLDTLAQTLGDLFPPVSQLLKQYDAARQRAQAAALRPDEARAYAVLAELAGGPTPSGDLLDWTDYARALERAGESRERAWTLLRALIEKHRALVRIQIVRE